MKRKITAKEQYTTYASFPLVAGDVRAYELFLDLGEDVSGAQFKVTAIRADGKVIEDIGSVKDGVATYTMASNMYSVPGELTVRLAVLHNSSVLTDREIIFEVLEGTSEADSAQTVVTINDSVILRLGAFEQGLAGKVDKISGKGLSANDFTDEYKERLDSLGDTIAKEVEKMSEDLDNLSDGFDEYKEKTDALLGKKADKSDIANVYRFKGSVKSESDLPFKYTFEVNGNPYIIENGEKQIIGTYESTGEVFFTNTNFTVPAGGERSVFFPVKTVRIKSGWYAISADVDFGDITVDLSNIDDCCFVIAGVPSAHASEPVCIEETDVTEIEVRYTASADNDGDVYFNFGESKITGSLEKIIYENTETNDGQLTELTAGDVYNVLDTDMNYAWTGAEWDALGGEHKDIEARNELERLSNELNKKANKEDAVSAYRFCGSVESFSDLPIKYDLIPNGVPTYNGEVCGSYDEETHTVTVNATELIEVDSDRIIVPIVPIKIKAGKYFCDMVSIGNAYIGNLCTYMLFNSVNMSEQTIDHIEIFTPNGNDFISGSTKNFGELLKVADSWFEERYPNIPYGAYEQGAIYEVKESGLNYGYTGSGWDALGTSHIDQEARGGIESLQNQIYDMNTGVGQAWDMANEANDRSYYNMYELESLRAEIEELKSKVLNA